MSSTSVNNVSINNTVPTDPDPAVDSASTRGPSTLIYDQDVSLAKKVRDYERQGGTVLDSTQTLNNIVIAAAFIGTSLTLPSVNASNQEITKQLQFYSEVAIFFGSLAFLFAISSSELISSLQRLGDDIYDDLVTLDTLSRLERQYTDERKKERMKKETKAIDFQSKYKQNHFQRAIRTAMVFTLLGLSMLSVSLIFIIYSKTIIEKRLITIATTFISFAAAAACVLFNFNHIIAAWAEKGWNHRKKNPNKTTVHEYIERTELSLPISLLPVDGEDRKAVVQIEGDNYCS